jgi:hypothetical protein
MRRTIAFIKLLVGLLIIFSLAWLSQQYSFKADLSSHGRNTLSPEATTVLRSLQGPLNITAVVQNNPELHRRIEKEIEPLQQTQANITLEFITAQMRITQDKTELDQSGQLELTYKGQQEILRSLNETDLIAAIRRLIRGDQRWVVFIEGHGEKSLFDKTATGYEKLDTLLKKQGYHRQSLNLVKIPDIPANTSLLVLAAPHQPILPGELDVITHYLKKGGNLLWLKEPHQPIKALQALIPLDFLPGVVISNNKNMRKVLGIQHPAVIPVVDYGNHEITQGLQGQSLLAVAGSMRFNGEMPWQATNLLLSLPESWNETGDLQGHVQFNQDAGEVSGPLSLGIALSRSINEQTQHIAVIGDSDFLSNDYLGYGQNPTFAANLFRWLSGDSTSPTIPVRPVPDAELNISHSTLLGFTVLFIVILPLTFIAFGIRLWIRRRRG